MSKLRNLQVKRLLKELEYVESDFDYRNEIISEADNNFIKCINQFLSQHPEIKEVYDKRVNEKIEKSIIKKIEDDNKELDIDMDSSQEIHEENNEDEKDKVNNENSKLKKVYREIVRLTHPDKTDKKRLNDLYILATNYYDNSDQIGLYKVCDELNIDYEIDETDEQSITDKISSLRTRIDFLEKTFTWKWHNCETEVEKNQIMINYIKLRIS
jgi:hypothetical protein